MRARAIDDSANIGAASDRHRHGRQRAGHLPVHDLARHGHTGRAPTPTRDPVEVGVKFRASTDGFITGIRYYKPAETTGTHVGSPVDQHRHPARPRSPSPTRRPAAGSRPASPRPVPVTANTTYVASYFTPDAGTSVSSRYFATSGTTRGPLTALPGRHRRRQRRLPLHRDAEHVPQPDLPERELLGRRRLHRGDRHHQADRHRPHARRRGHRRRARRATSPRPSASRPAVDHHRSSCARPAAAVVPATMSYDATTRTATLDPTARARRHDDLHRHAHRRPRHRRQPDGRRRPGPSPPTHRTRPSPTVTGRTPAVGATGVALGVAPTADVQRGGAAGHDHPRAPRPRQHAGARHDDVRRRHPHRHPRPERQPRRDHDVHRQPQRRQGRRRATRWHPVSWSFTTTTVTSRLPVHDLAVDGDPGGHRRRHQLGRAGREVPGEQRRLRHRHPLLPAQPGHRHPRRQPVEPRPAPGSASVTFTDEARPAGGSRRPSPRRSRSTAGTTYVASYYTPSRYVAERRLLRHRGHHARTAHGPAERHRRRQRPLPLHLHAQHVPQPDASTARTTGSTSSSRTARTPPSRPSPARTPAPGATGVSVGRQRDRDVLRAGAAGRRSASSSADPAARWSPAPRRTTPRPAPPPCDPAPTWRRRRPTPRPSAGVRDTAGNQIDPVSWTFTTDAPDTTKPTRHRPHPRARGDRRRRRRSTPTATFSEPVQAGDDHLRAARRRAARSSRRPRPTTRRPARRPSTPTAQPGRQHDVHGDASAAPATPPATRWTRSPGLHHRGHRVELPVHDLAGDHDPGRHRPGHQLGRARREVPDRHGRLHHRHPLLQAQPDHRHPRRQPVDHDRHPARPRSPSPARRPAAGSRRPSLARSPVTANTTYVASYFTPSRYAVNGGYFASAPRPAAR